MKIVPVTQEPAWWQDYDLEDPPQSQRGHRFIYFLWQIQFYCGARTSHYSVGFRVYSRSKAVAAWCWPTYLSIARLRISGAVPVVPLYAFMTWTGATFLLPFRCIHINKGTRSRLLEFVTKKARTNSDTCRTWVTWRKRRFKIAEPRISKYSYSWNWILQNVA